MGTPMPEDGPFFLEIRLSQTDPDTKAAYDNLYAAEGLSQIPSFYHWLLGRLRLPQQGSLLDVSCGAGEVIELVARRGLQATGVDISYLAARSAYQRAYPRASVATSAGEQLPFPAETFDFVTNIGSLEHFLDPGAGVREMARVLRPGGKAYILVPNTFSLLTNVWIAYRQGRVSIDDQPLQRYGTRADWSMVIEKNGLCIERTIKYERPWPRLAVDYGYYLRRPKEALRLLVSPFVPLNLAFCFLFLCVKPANRQRQILD
jgi:SAM-dependent methyltransferase